MTHLAAPGTTAPAITGYTWVRALGSGGFADVHLYHQLLPSRDVAIKIVRSPGDQAGVEELRREADAWPPWVVTRPSSSSTAWA